jgi:hypothetical protein
VGSVLIHLVTSGSTPAVRRLAISSTEAISASFPATTNLVLRDALIATVSREPKPPPKTAAAADEDGSSKDAHKESNYRAKLAGLLYACATFGEDVELQTKQSLLADLVVLGHHPAISGCLLSFIHQMARLIIF